MVRQNWTKLPRAAVHSAFLEQLNFTALATRAEGSCFEQGIENYSNLHPKLFYDFVFQIITVEDFGSLSSRTLRIG